MKENIKPATGRLGVLVVGVGGAVATTMITGTLAARKGLAKAIGSIAQMATMRMQDGKEHLIKDVVPLVDLNDIVFGGWDIFADDAYEAAMYAEVLKEKDLNLVKDELKAIKPMPAAFDHNFAKRLNGTHIKNAATRWDMVEQLREDIRNFKAANNCDRIAVLWAASTEIYVPLSEEHKSLAALEKAMKENNTEVVSPSMCYAYAAIAEGAPFIMGAPNLCVDTPAMWEFSKKMNVPIAGKDFKSGQTLMKTVLAPMFKTRMLGVSGWFSTNILGNRDGEVLDQPENFKTKEVSKLSVIDNIFEPEKFPDLYGDVYHKVQIREFFRFKDIVNNRQFADFFCLEVFRLVKNFTVATLSWQLLLHSTWLFSVILLCVRVCAVFRLGCHSSARARCMTLNMNRYTTCSNSGEW